MYTNNQKVLEDYAIHVIVTYQLDHNNSTPKMPSGIFHSDYLKSAMIVSYQFVVYAIFNYHNVIYNYTRALYIQKYYYNIVNEQ